MKPTALMPAPAKLSPPGLELGCDVAMAPKETLTHVTIKMADQRSAHRFVQFPVLFQFRNKPVSVLKNGPQLCSVAPSGNTSLSFMLHVDTNPFVTVSYSGTRKQGSPHQLTILVLYQPSFPATDAAQETAPPKN
jgi:hypothetical protein